MMEKSNKFLEGPLQGTMPSLKEMILAPILFLMTLSVGFSGVELISSWIYDLRGGSIEEVINITYFMQLWIGFGLSILMLFLFITKVNRRSIRSLGFYKEKAIKRYIGGVLLGGVATSIIVGINVLSGQMTLERATFALGINTLFWVSLIVIGWMIQGAAEELLVRGYLLPTLSIKYGLYYGIIISSVVFASLHIGNEGVSVLSLLNILLCGVALALLATYQQSIWGVCGFHTAWNLVQGNIFGIAVSGQPIRKSLWRTGIVEPNIISGGQFGIEGSILTTVFFIIMITYLVSKISKL